jgi:RNA polymerase sigma-70 factor, ECF subfamily
VALRADDVDLDRDAALVERFQTGDEDAFADLYQRYFGRLRRYCQRRLGDPHDAEEAAQETLVKAYRALPGFGGDRRFYPWLRVIAANVCNDRGKRKPVAALADPDGGDVVVDSVFQAIDHDQVRAALQELTPRHRAALSLWADGRPSRQIAEELGCSTGAADVTLHRARQSFRARFSALSGEGKFGIVGLVPALGRWAQRFRARVVTRVGDHADLGSPLATKLAAGAIAFTVVGGAVAAVPTSHQGSPTAPPTSIVTMQTTPASAHGPAPSVVTEPAARPTAAAPAPARSAAAATSSPAPRTPPGTPAVAGARVMSASAAKEEGQGDPIHVEVPGVGGVDVDPQGTIAGLVPGSKGAS